jgi:hypothetical protein
MGMRRAWLLAVALVLAASAPVFAKEGLEVLRTFENGDQKIQVATFTQGSETVGLLGIRAGNRVSFSSRRGMWRDILALLEQAARVQDTRWRFVGALTETDTTNPSHLVVYGGPALQIILMDPSVGARAFTFKEGDRAALAEALRLAEGNLTP